MKRLGSEGLADAFDNLRTQSAALATSSDPEILHQLRVAVRRLRVALRVFKGVLDPEPEDSLRTDLKWLFQELGALRDLHVFSASLEERLIPRRPGTTALRRSVQRRIAQRRKTVLAALSSRRFHRLGDEIAALVKRADRRGPSERKLMRRLRKLRRRTLRACSDVLRDERGIHTARKELKKLRYACEFGAPLLPKARTRHYLKTIKQAQDQLGGIVDLSVWLHMVRVHCRAEALRQQLTAGLQRERELAASRLAAPVERLLRARPPWR